METCVQYAAFATQSLLMAPLEAILLHSQKRLPKIGKTDYCCQTRPRPLGRKIGPKNNLCPTHSGGKNLPRASALAPQAMYGFGAKQ